MEGKIDKKLLDSFEIWLASYVLWIVAQDEELVKDVQAAARLEQRGYLDKIVNRD